MATTPQPATTNPHRREWPAALGITLAIGALHFYNFLHRGGFWRDECDLINLSRLESWYYLRHDSFPMLMALLVHGWTQLAGDSDAALQSLGLLIGLGGIGALWAASLGNRSAPPLLSLVLFGLNSTVISYGDELRAYGLGSALIIGCIAAAWAFLKNSSRRNFLLFLGLALLSVQTLFQNAVALAAICAGGWAVCLRHNQRKTAFLILLTGLVAAVSLSPYANVVSVSYTYTHTAAATHDWLAKNFPQILAPLFNIIQFPFDGFGYLWIALTLALIALGVIRWRVNLHSISPVENADATLFAGVILLTTIPGYIGFFWTLKFIPFFWHFLALLAVAAACFVYLPLPSQRFQRICVWGFLLGTAVIGAAFAHRDLQTRFTNLDLVAARLKTLTKPGDYVLVTPWYCGISFARYHQAPPAWDTIPPLADHHFHHADLIQPKMLSPDAIQPVFENISATLQAGHRVWIVGAIEIPDLATPAPANLPAPPLPETGWNSLPYNDIWERQIAHYVRDHTYSFKLVPLGIVQPVNFFENLPLNVAEGWRTDIISPPPVVVPLKQLRR